VPAEIGAGDRPRAVRFQITIAAEAIDTVQGRLVTAGAHRGDRGRTRARAGARRLAGPASEVDEKTIPQEVRLEKSAACRTRRLLHRVQETVSRLHFRGHANRNLRA